MNAFHSQFDSIPLPQQERKPRFAFSLAAPVGVSVSADGLAVTHVGTQGWLGALVEPAVSSAKRYYAEWVIEAADVNCAIMIGVTDLDAAPPAEQYIYSMPGSRMYVCHNSTAQPGGRAWGATGQRVRGERVGLLVERGSLSVYINGARLGPGPMATDLPQRVQTSARARTRALKQSYDHTGTQGGHTDVCAHHVRTPAHTLGGNRSA